MRERKGFTFTAFVQEGCKGTVCLEGCGTRKKPLTTRDSLWRPKYQHRCWQERDDEPPTVNDVMTVVDDDVKPGKCYVTQAVEGALRAFAHCPTFHLTRTQPGCSRRFTSLHPLSPFPLFNLADEARIRHRTEGVTTYFERVSICIFIEHGSIYKKEKLIL